jgi:hypothetical protein
MNSVGSSVYRFRELAGCRVEQFSYGSSIEEEGFGSTSRYENLAIGEPDRGVICAARAHIAHGC